MDPIPDGATKRVRLHGKVLVVPMVTAFRLPMPRGGEKLEWHLVEVTDFRCPRAGEWYLSGAIAEAWIAPNDLTMEYPIVKPGKKVVSRKFWIEDGEERRKLAEKDDRMRKLLSDARGKHWDEKDDELTKTQCGLLDGYEDGYRHGLGEDDVWYRAHPTDGHDYCEGYSWGWQEGCMDS